jgi:hypothetical protein
MRRLASLSIGVAVGFAVAAVVQPFEPRNVAPAIHWQLGRRHPSSIAPLFSQPNNDKEDFKIRNAAFNPLNYQASTLQQDSLTSSRSFSLRKIQLQQIYKELLSVAENESKDGKTTSEKLQHILETNKAVFLEQLEEEDAVLDAESVILPGMDRAERFCTYLASLEERIQAAKRSPVEAVLRAIYKLVKDNE